MTSNNKRWPTILVGAAAACVLAVVISYFRTLQPYTPDETSTHASLPRFNQTGQSAVCISLATALPGSVYSSQHPTFQKSVGSYHSLNAREIEPTCIVQPGNVQDVATAVKVLKSEFDTAKDSPPIFAVRSGGHSPEAGFANVNGGVVIDMSLINGVTVSEDQRLAVLGVGARWLDVSSKLDSMGLAVAGGRDSNVGVGGFVLGGTFAADLTRKLCELPAPFTTTTAMEHASTRKKHEGMRFSKRIDSRKAER